MNPSRRKSIIFLSSIPSALIFPGVLPANASDSYSDQILQFGLICSRFLLEQYPNEYHSLHLFAVEDSPSQIEKDFLGHQIIIIEGWILSLTEVKLFALAAMASRKHEGLF